METADEITAADAQDAAEPAEYGEAWPIPPEDSTRAFEQFLLDIGLRF